MKESKKFFEKNSLNKGYAEILDYDKKIVDQMGVYLGDARQDEGGVRYGRVSASDISQAYAKFKHMLPPIEIIEEYEQMYPGTFAKLLDMAELEQHHRHSLDLAMQEKYNRATILGRYFSLILMTLISFTTLVLALSDAEIAAAVFALAAFGCIYFVSRSCSEDMTSGGDNVTLNSDHRAIRYKNYKSKEASADDASGSSDGGLPPSSYEGRGVGRRSQLFNKRRRNN